MKFTRRRFSRRRPTYKRKRFASRRRSFSRRSFKRARISRPLNNFGNYYKISRSLISTVSFDEVAGTPFQLFQLAQNLDELNNESEFYALFKFFRIAEVKFQLLPPYNSTNADQADTEGNIYGHVTPSYTGNFPATLADLTQHKFTTHNMFKPHTWYVKRPKCYMSGQSADGTTTYPNFKWPGWLDCDYASNTALAHYGPHLFLDYRSMGASANRHYGVWTLVKTCVIECKEKR